MKHACLDPTSQRQLSTAYWNSLRREDIPILTERVCSLFDVVDDEFMGYLQTFLFRIEGYLSHCTTVDTLVQRTEACKARYNALYELIVQMLDLLEAGCSMYLTRRGGKPFLYTGIDTEIHIEDEFMLEEDEVTLTLKLTGKPKLYGALAKAVIRSIQLVYNKVAEDQCTWYSGLLPYLQVILTVGQIYDDLRGDSSYINRFEEEAYSNLTRQSVHLQSDVAELMEILRRDISLGRRAPLYVRDLATVLPYVDFSPYSYEDYFVSLRSSGTKADGRGIPALAASIVETDRSISCEDDLISYKSYYRQDSLSNVEQRHRVTLTIEQHKLKRRVIHIADNAVQDRCRWFHRRLERILRRLPSDCTFDQDAGRRFAQQATVRAAHEDKNIYSADISSATDNLSREFQERVLALVFGEELSKYWMRLATEDSSFAFHDRSLGVRTLHSERGQPQGYQGSFPAFALAHHIVMRLTMLVCNMQTTKPESIYRVLGDDSIVTLQDPEQMFRKTYEYICHQIGWEINHAKGYYYISDSACGLASAEFAKIRYCNGRALCPLPLMLFLGLKSRQGIPSAAIYIAKWLKVMDIYTYMSILDYSGFLLDSEVQLIYLYNKLDIGIFKYLIKDNEDTDPVSNEAALAAYVTFFRRIMKNTILYQWLPLEDDSSKDVQVQKAMENSSTFLEWIGFLEQRGDLDSNHKIWYLMDKQDALIEISKRVFTEFDISLCYGVISLPLSEKDQETLLRAMEILDDLQQRVARYELEDCKKTLQSALDILSRYQPRSETRKSTRNSHGDDYLEDSLYYLSLLGHLLCKEDYDCSPECLPG